MYIPILHLIGFVVFGYILIRFCEFILADEFEGFFNEKDTDPK